MADRHEPKRVKVMVSDTDTGEVLREQIVDNDYLLITAGVVVVKSIQTFGRTHSIAVGPPAKSKR